MLFVVEGWIDWNDDRHLGPATDLENTQGVIVHTFDPENDPYGEHDEWFTAWSPEGFESWEEWYVYIGALMVGNYGMELA